MSTAELEAQAVPELESGAASPETRALPLVLRRLLAEAGGGVSLLVGKVTAIPDAKHVEVEVAGERVVIPGLAGYVPVVGEGCWCLQGSSTVLAIGSASGMRPTTIPAGTAPGQVPVWDATLGAWVPQAKAPNADTLDGVDSAGFLRRKSAGTEEVWYGRVEATISGAGVSVHAHGLGRVPVHVQASKISPGSGVDPTVTDWTAASISLWWQGFTSGTANVWLLVIG